MPFVASPTVGADIESWVLDGLELNDRVTFYIREGEVDMAPPRQRPEWIGAADSEWQSLMRNPLHENRVVVLPLQVAAGANKDAALNRIGLLQDMLATASQTEDGIPLVWRPAGSARTITFDVLSGEITELPLDRMFSVSSRPRVTVTVTCKPYWRGVEALTSTASSGATPFATLEIANSVGEVPALGRLIVTDTASQARRLVEWGLEGPLTYNAATSLIIDSDSMTTSGFAGTGSTQAGAYDPNASGNNVVSMSLLGPQAMAGFTGTHSGVFRVKGRFYCNTGAPESTKIRLVWKDQDNPQTANAYVRPTVGIGWNRLDLGTITVSGSWSGYVEASSPYYTETLKLDYLELIPVTAGYGKARATYSYQPGITVARDEFTGTTAAGALNTRTAPAGGSWATSGATGDFLFADDLSDEQLKRSTASDTGPRLATLGGSQTEQEIAADVTVGAPGTTSNPTEGGVIGRYVDASNYLRGVISVTKAAIGVYNFRLRIVQRIAGVETTLATSGNTQSAGTVRMVVFSSGRAILALLVNGVVVASVEASTTVLSSGALASGKPGLYDYNPNPLSPIRYYDNFRAATPQSEPVVIYPGRTLEITGTDTIRQNSGATATGRPQSYRGSRFTVPVGTSRVLVAARRSDTDTTLDDNVTDDATQIQVAVTARGLAVPRA